MHVSPSTILSEHYDVDSHNDVLSDTSITHLSSFDCSFAAAGLAEASLSEAPLKDSAAAEEDKDQTALAKPLSVLIVSEHSDVETDTVLTDMSNTNPSSFYCSFDGAGLRRGF